MPLKLSTDHEGRRGLTTPIFIGVCAFIFGLISGRIPSTYDAQQKLHLPAASTNSTRLAAPPVEKFDEPLGLTWLKKGHDNPWQFSVLRSTVQDLNDSVTRILNSRARLPRTVVSFTSLPNRLAKHGPEMISLLKRQTYTPDMIYICIPQGSRRSNDSFQIPRWMQNDPLITVLRPEVDLGPATKLIPALEAEIKLGNLDARVVTVDDDNEGGWTEDSLLDLLAYSLHYPDAVVGLTGWNVTCMVSDARCLPDDSGVPMRQNLEWMYNFVKHSHDYACHTLADWLVPYYANCLGAIRKNFIGFVDVLEGYKGIVYQPRFFNMEQLNLLSANSTPDYFFLCDDVWFAGWLGVQNIKKIVVNPAVYLKAPVRITLMEYSEGRNLTVKHLEPSQMYIPVDEEKTEAGLHSLGADFASANFMAVQWFEDKSAWVPDMWKRPAGFLYPSERNDREIVL